EEEHRRSYGDLSGGRLLEPCVGSGRRGGCRVVEFGGHYGHRTKIQSSSARRSARAASRTGAAPRCAAGRKPGKKPCWGLGDRSEPDWNGRLLGGRAPDDD